MEIKNVTAKSAELTLTYENLFDIAHGLSVTSGEGGHLSEGDISRIATIARVLVGVFSQMEILMREEEEDCG